MNDRLAAIFTPPQHLEVQQLLAQFGGAAMLLKAGTDGTAGRSGCVNPTKIHEVDGRCLPNAESFMPTQLPIRFIWCERPNSFYGVI